MPSSTILNSLKINKLTEAQFDAAVQQGVIGANDLSILIDADNPNIQVTTLPTASIDELGKIYQYVGTTDSTYTNGYFYKCVSDGQSTPTYSWTAVQVQAGGGGGSYTAGSGIDITSGVISVTEPIAKFLDNGVGNKSVYGFGANTTYANSQDNTIIGKNAYHDGSSVSSAVAVGANSKVGNGATAIGGNADAQSTEAIAIGGSSKANTYGAIQIGYGTNNTANTFQVKSYTMMSADGTIPTDRFTTTPVADGTYVPTLTISSGNVTRSWSTGGSSYTAGTNISISNDTISTSAAQVVIRRFS